MSTASPAISSPETLSAGQEERLLEAQRQILQNEKLASVGRLAAGIAHEINTPIQYVGDNIRALEDFYEDLFALIAEYRKLVQQVSAGESPGPQLEQIATAEREADLSFILEDVPKAIEQALEGVSRVSKIVRAMKEFSHEDRGTASAVDLNRALESTLTVARNEYKYVAEVETEFGTLPEVECYASALNQVFLNLLVNAAHAIADTEIRGLITVRTRAEADFVEVSIADTGTGIPAEVQDKIFDPFFTTKEVGRGTGQGLSIAHQIVVQRHGGTLTFDTQSGRGTCFFIRIPLKLKETTPEL